MGRRKKKDINDKLTPLQAAWVTAYKGEAAGNATEAARIAGYKPNNDDSFRVIGSENLTILNDFIADYEQKIKTPNIADINEINTFWTDIMRDGEQDVKDRLKASELRAKAAGMFIDKVSCSGDIRVNNPFEGLTTEELKKLIKDG